MTRTHANTNSENFPNGVAFRFFLSAPRRPYPPRTDVRKTATKLCARVSGIAKNLPNHGFWSCTVVRHFLHAVDLTHLVAINATTSRMFS